MTVKELWGLVKAAASGWVDDYVQSMGAALAYYTMFSIAPLLLIVISIAELVGDEAARGDVNKGAPRRVKQQHSSAGVTPPRRESSYSLQCPKLEEFLPTPPSGPGRTRPVAIGPRWRGRPAEPIGPGWCRVGAAQLLTVRE